MRFRLLAGQGSCCGVLRPHFNVGPIRFTVQHKLGAGLQCRSDVHEALIYRAISWMEIAMDNEFLLSWRDPALGADLSRADEFIVDCEHLYPIPDQKAFILIAMLYQDSVRLIVESDVA
jgi:hypothetical protein